MDKLKKEIKEIVTIVREAFEDMEMLNCTPEGLFNYIKYGNEAFIYKSQEDDKLCYLCAFQYYVEKTKLNFSQESMKKIVDEIEVLKGKYPKHFDLISDILV